MNLYCGVIHLSSCLSEDQVSNQTTVHFIFYKKKQKKKHHGCLLFPQYEESIFTRTDCSPFGQKNWLKDEMLQSCPVLFPVTRFSPQSSQPFWSCICQSSLLAKARDLGEEPDLPLRLYTRAGSIFWARSSQGLRTPSWLTPLLAELYCEGKKHRERRVRVLRMHTMNLYLGPKWLNSKT